MMIANVSDKHAREAALDTTKSFIVQAPAGSGKTELLIQRYLKLLSIVNQPEEIIAITFTNKAANEIKQRILDALSNAERKIIPKKKHEILTAQFATRALKRNKQKKWNLLLSNQRIKVMTLDSLCFEIVSMAPLSSNFGLNKSVKENHELMKIYKQSSISALNIFFDSKSYRKDAEIILNHLDANIDKYSDYMAQMLVMREQWSFLIGGGAGNDKMFSARLRKSLESNIQKTISIYIDDLNDSFPEKAFKDLYPIFDYLSQENDLFMKILNGHKHNTMDNYHHVCYWRAIADLLITNSGSWRKRIDASIGIPPSEKNLKNQLTDIIRSLQSNEILNKKLFGLKSIPEPFYNDNQWEVLLSLLRLLPIVIAELKTVFTKNNICDYTEISDSANKSISDEDDPSDLSLIMDYKIKHILLDESQDTSQRQYQFIKNLINGWEQDDGRTLFFVGDPMQSIYRFRNARVSLFLSISKNGIGSLMPHNLVLTNNFRSGGILVENFNKIFSTIFPKKLNIHEGSVNYTKSFPMPDLLNEGSFEIHPLFNENHASEAEYVASLVANKIDESKGSIALIVRSRLHLMDILKELRSKNIKYSALELDKLTDVPEIIELIAITRALANREDRAAWIAILRSPLVGLNWKEILSISSIDDYKDMWSILEKNNLNNSLSPKSAESLDRFFRVMRKNIMGDGISSLRDRIERIWYALDGLVLTQDPSQLDNVKLFLNIIEDIEVGGTIEDPASLEVILDQYRVTSPKENNSQVNIMTIHRSKGLEFDHIIIPSLGRAIRPPEKTLINWLENPSKKNEIIMSPIGAGKNDKLHNFIQNFIKESDSHEINRLLYVAFTRASESLDIVGNVNVNFKDGAPLINTPSKSSLLYKLWPVISDAYKQKLARINTPSELTSVDGIYILPKLRRIVPKIDKQEIEKMPFCESYKSLNPESNTDVIEFSWAGENSKHAGKIIHKWLQIFSTDKQVTPLDEIRDYKEINLNLARNNNVNEDQLENVLSKVDFTLNNAINDKKNHWIFTGEGYSEIPLSGLYKNQFYSIVIDRINIDDEGNHWLIDYKTGTHEGAGIEDFIKEEIKRYRTQLEKYAEIYEAYSNRKPIVRLYYPNLSQLIEIDRLN